MKQKINVKRLLRFGISFVLVLILSTGVLLAAAARAFQKNTSYETFLSVLQKMEYAEEVREDVRGVYQNLELSSGIPADVTDAFLNEDVTDDDILLPIRQIFTEETLTLDMERMKEDFCLRVDRYARDLRDLGEMDVTDEEFEEILETFPKTADYYVDELASSIRLSGTYSVLGSAISFALRLSPILFYASLALALFAAILLILIQRGKILLWAYAGIGSASVVLFVPIFWYRSTNFVLRLGIEPGYFKSFIHETVLSFCDGFEKNAILLLCAALLCFAGYGILLLMKTREKKKEPEEGKENVL